MSGKEEGGKLVTMPPQEETLSKKQEQERFRMQETMRKNAERDLADYRKRLRLSNELKTLQNEEIELNISHYKLKESWLNDYYPKMEALEKKEKEIMEAEDKKNREEAKKQAEEAEKRKKDAEKPDIVVSKMGKARE